MLRSLHYSTAAHAAWLACQGVISVHLLSVAKLAVYSVVVINMLFTWQLQDQALCKMLIRKQARRLSTYRMNLGFHVP